MKDSSCKVPKKYSSRPLILIGILMLVVILYIRLTKLISESTSPPPTEVPIPKVKNPYSVKARLKVSEASYQSYVKKRKAFVKGNPSKIRPWPTTGKSIYFWDYFLPTFSCPHSIDRIGTLGDGGKYVCGIELFNKTDKKGKANNKPCVVYSFGVSYESSFEAEFLEKTNCEIYAYDGSVNKMGPQLLPGLNPRVHFHKAFVGGKSKKAKTLGSIMTENGHSWIDFLKMDIEGAELDLLNQVMDEFDVLPFGQMQIEIHGDGLGKKFLKIYKLWERMEDKGLRAFKNEVNYWPSVSKHKNPYLIEYSFINLHGEHRIVT